MADSKRLTILKALTTLLEGITPANGFDHDLSGKIYRGRNQFSSEEPLPAVSILEGLNPDRQPDPAGGNIKRAQKDDWILLVQGWVDDDKTHPTDPAHNLMADVKKRLAKIVDDSDNNTDFMLGDLIADLAMEPGTVRPPDELSARAYFYMRIVLTVVERVYDPYSLT